MKKSGIITFSILMGASLLLAGCGKGPDSEAPADGASAAQTAAPTPSTSCPAGMAAIPGGACVSSSAIYAQCAYYGGKTVTVNSQTVCRFELRGTSFTGYLAGANPVPRLSRSTPAEQYSFSTGIEVFENDLVTIDATGSWWSEGSGFSCGTQINADGYAGSTLLTNEGEPEGLFATDGTEAFFIGSKITERRITHHGALKVGFNMAGYKIGCYKLVWKPIQVSRCYDLSGNRVSCQ